MEKKKKKESKACDHINGWVWIMFLWMESLIEKYIKLNGEYILYGVKVIL